LKSQEVVIVQGNEACVRGAIAAGCRFFAGYPITPASEIAELMAVEIPRRQGIFIQMEDEIASIAALIGASWGGHEGLHGHIRSRLLAYAGGHRLCR
jgi:2-oxoglutarate ferredoxin oxidoreductase subunit alpha